MKPLSEKVAAIAPSATIEISNRAKKMQREGIDVISLSIGEPDFDTPKHIRDACVDALNRGETHYAPSNGIPELLSAISDKIAKENKFPCKPEQVIVTCGAKDAIYEGMEAALNPGDEVILLTGLGFVRALCPDGGREDCQARGQPEDIPAGRLDP